MKTANCSDLLDMYLYIPIVTKYLLVLCSFIFFLIPFSTRELYINVKIQMANIFVCIFYFVVAKGNFFISVHTQNWLTSYMSCRSLKLSIKYENTYQCTDTFSWLCLFTVTYSALGMLIFLAIIVSMVFLVLILFLGGGW